MLFLSYCVQTPVQHLRDTWKCGSLVIVLGVLFCHEQMAALRASVSLTNNAFYLPIFITDLKIR